MGWNRETIRAMADEGLFHNQLHMSRFKELTDVFSDEPFFTVGLCKCMYLSSWDDEHFGVILEILNLMHLGKSPDLEEMEENGEMLVDNAEKLKDFYIMKLSFAFLHNKDFAVDELPDEIEPEARLIILQALNAAEIIEDYNPNLR